MSLERERVFETLTPDYMYIPHTCMLQIAIISKLCLIFLLKKKTFYQCGLNRPIIVEVLE